MTARLRPPSELETTFAFQLRVAGLPAPEREFHFARGEGREFRFDFAWPDHLLAVEVDGATYAQGRHSRGDGIHRDCEKVSLAAVLGWRVMRFDKAMVEDGSGLVLLERALRFQR